MTTAARFADVNAPRQINIQRRDVATVGDNANLSPSGLIEDGAVDPGVTKGKRSPMRKRRHGTKLAINACEISIL